MDRVELLAQNENPIPVWREVIKWAKLYGFDPDCDLNTDDYDLLSDEVFAALFVLENVTDGWRYEYAFIRDHTFTRTRVD